MIKDIIGVFILCMDHDADGMPSHLIRGSMKIFGPIEIATADHERRRQNVGWKTTKSQRLDDQINQRL